MSRRWYRALAALVALVVVVDPAAAQRRDGDGYRGGEARGDFRGGRDGDGRRDERYGLRNEDVVELGRNKVDFGRDRDVIRIGEAEGTFQSIFLEVRDGDVFVNDIEIVYGNGNRERLEINRMLRSGERSVPIDLRKDRRLIREIDLRYQARPGERRRPTVTVFGTRPPLRIGDKVGNFDVIGIARVDGGEDTTRARLDRDDGRIGRIKLRSTDGSLFVRGMDITFGNGDVQRVDINQRLGEGEETSAIDIAGFNRNIRDITIYTRDRRRGGGARIAILGNELPPLIDIPHDWIHFGTASVGLHVDKDAIRVGRAEGRFKSILLKVSRNDILLREVKIVYDNGEVDTRPAWLYMPAGSRTPAIDLKGRDRFIREIQLTYQSRPDRRGQQAEVDVYGEYTDSWMRDNAAIYDIPREWVSFGTQGFDFGRNQTAIQVGRQRDTKFRRIALIARNNDVYVSSVTIVYGNGSVDKREINRYLVANSRTLPIELKGDRNIAEIKVDYQSRFNWRGRQATVEVLGEPIVERGRGFGAEPGWDLLGTHRVSMLFKDYDSFKVGDRAGRFRSLRIMVRGGDVRFYAMRIVYGNGSTEDLVMSGELRDGQASQVLDLKGRDRVIDRVDFKYRAKLGLKKPPEVEIWGRR
ncbi:MAG: hypothetical protein AB1749_01805 [Pseudomonadota bacterium]